MMAAIRLLKEKEGVLTEPAGAAATAAFMKSAAPEAANIALLATGSNIAPDVYRAVFSTL
jgi:threonine synthase